MSAELVAAVTPEKAARRRNQNACDACRARKVKCINDGVTCRSCLALQIPCSRDRIRKKRGPLNQYVATQVQQPPRVETPAVSPAISTSAIFSERPCIEQLAPIFVVHQILADWFEFVHPLAPIVHRDTLMRRLASPVDSQELEVVDLVTSLCAATLATLRTRASNYAPAVTVEKCYQTIIRRQNAPSQIQQTLSLAWCQTKYNLSTSLTAERGIDDPTPQLLLAEALTGIGHLFHHEIRNMSFVEQELLKRLYWLCFATQCSRGLHGRPYLNLVKPNLTAKAMKPLEITDAELATVTVGEEKWHGNTRSYIPGLNILSQLFMMWHDSQQGDNNDVAHWHKWMDTALSALDHVPPELRWRGGLTRPPRGSFGTDVQMVNLHITQIHIRSFLLDQMDRIAKEVNESTIIAEVTGSRQDLIDDMLAIVYQVPEDTLEANGYSLVTKLRDIGVALLDINSEKGFFNLDRLLAKLERLDGTRRNSRFDSTSPLEFLTAPSIGT